MSGWDKNQIYTSGQRQKEVGFNDQFTANEYLNDRTKLEEKFFQFVYNFQSQQGGFKYRDQLISNLKVEYYGLDIDFRDLVTYDESLSQHLKDYPTQFLDSFEIAIEACAQRIVSTSDDADLTHDLLTNAPSFQAVLKSLDTIDNLHQLTAESVSKLINVTGVIVSASSLSLKATTLHLRCKNCGHTKKISVSRGLNGIQVPRSCDNPNKDNNTDKCPIDPFDVDFTQSKSVDQQLLKLQECPDNVEPGELPKHLLLSADRCLVNQVVPGTRTSVIGVYSTFQSGSSQGSITRNPYIRVVGFSSETLGIRTRLRFEDSEMKEMEAMARTPGFIDRLTSSIAPSIFGNQNMKAAVACLLMGGSTKVLPDGMRLRGDINVLMLGDPSTAKSQLLKFAEKVAPVAVYTSGKGSSAAGLTASVVREAGSREFYLEGGAMVLADGGIVCIDEFDKMRDEDRVAIHEAMEQQTISIAKAGITTVLNARTSVLAAANPIFGRYNDLKSAGDNIDFQTTILSRFDLIFIVKDRHDRQRDAIIAKHVMDIHLQQDLNHADNLDADKADSGEGVISAEVLQKFISYAKVKVQPRLTEAASKVLIGEFVELRQKVKDMEVETDQRSAIPMTIRQLEAIVRLSESFARMQLTNQADESHVRLAMQLFKNSTFEAVRSHEKQFGQNGVSINSLIKEAEKQIRNRMKPGNTVLVETIVNELSHLSFTQDLVEKCIMSLVTNETLQFRNNRKSVYRPFN